MDDSELDDNTTRSRPTGVRAYIRLCVISGCVAVALLIILSLVVLLPVMYDTLSSDEDMQVLKVLCSCGLLHLAAPQPEIIIPSPSPMQLFHFCLCDTCF